MNESNEENYTRAAPVDLSQEHGCTIKMVSDTGVTLAWITNPKIENPQDLADDVSALIAEHNELVAKATKEHHRLSLAYGCVTNLDLLLRMLKAEEMNKELPMTVKRLTLFAQDALDAYYAPEGELPF